MGRSALEAATDRAQVATRASSLVCMVANRSRVLCVCNECIYISLL